MTINLLGKEREIYVFDYEVLSRVLVPETNQSYWCVVFINYYTGQGKIIKNNVEELREFYKQTKDDIFVSYNGRNYDQYIHKGILLGMDAGYINDRIILDNAKGYQVVPKANKVPFYNFDIASKFHSLKQLEGFMGDDIRESSVPFDIDRPLTIDEEKELIKYCIHDVKETVEVLRKRWTDFTSHIGLMEMFNLDMNMISKTSAQMTAQILEANKREQTNDEFDFIYPKTLKLEKYSYIKEFFDNLTSANDENGKKNELVTTVGGVETSYLLGGLHGAIPNYHDEGLLVSADVASLYPALIINYNLMSRAVNGVDKFKEIRDTRLKYKAQKNPLQASLKITINSVYGCFGDQYNPLCDFRMMRSVCVAGQLLLTDLIEKIEDYCTPFNLNTDGVFMKVKDEETLRKIQGIAKEWEERTGLELEWERYTKVHQKDVNSYIIIAEDGHYKGKGSYVKDLNDLDYDLPIVNKAIVEYFTNNTPIEQTINNCNELREFQKIVKLTSAYDYVIKDRKMEKVKVINPKTGRLKTEEQCVNEGHLLSDKTFRVFASTREDDWGLFKQKKGKNPEKFANTPEKCFIDNGNIKGKSTPEYLDKQYYIDLTQERIYQFLGLDKHGKPKKKKSTKNKK